MSKQKVICWNSDEPRAGVMPPPFSPPDGWRIQQMILVPSGNHKNIFFLLEEEEKKEEEALVILAAMAVKAARDLEREACELLVRTAGIKHSFPTVREFAQEVADQIKVRRD